MKHVSCLIPYGHVRNLRQSWSTFTHWGQALIYYWLGLSTDWGLNTHLQQLAFILFFLYYCFSIFCKFFTWLAWLSWLALCPNSTRRAFLELVSLKRDCGLLFTTCKWVHDNTSPIVFKPSKQLSAVISPQSAFYTAPFANKLWYCTSASNALLTGKNSGRIKEKVFFQCSSHKTFRFGWFKNEFLISRQRCFQIRASAFNADLSANGYKDLSSGNTNAVLANRIIRCIFTLNNKIIRCIYLCSCVLESFWKGFESDQRRLTLLVSKCVCLSSLWKHPFLLALRCWGRFALRNVCDSVTEISYRWPKSVRSMVRSADWSTE